MSHRAAALLQKIAARRGCDLMSRTEMALDVDAAEQIPGRRERNGRKRAWSASVGVIGTMSSRA